MNTSKVGETVRESVTKIVNPDENNFLLQKIEQLQYGHF